MTTTEATFARLRRLVALLAIAAAGLAAVLWHVPPGAQASSADPGVWIQVHPQTLPPGRYDAAAAWDGHEVLMFGGGAYSGGPDIHDTWTWNGWTWTQLHPPTSPPRLDGGGAWDGHRAVFFGNGATWGQTWAWDSSTWTQLHPASSPTPPRGVARAMAYDGHGVVMYGGQDANGDTLSDTWTWDGSTWTQQHPAHSPGPLRVSYMCWDAGRGVDILVGGTNGSTNGRDAWTWNGADWSDTNTSPMQVDGLAFDGVTDVLAVNHTYTWTGSSWTQYTGTAPFTFDPAMVYDPGNNDIVFFGGLGASNIATNDTWIWSTSDTVPTPPPATPSPKPSTRPSVKVSPTPSTIVASPTPLPSPSPTPRPTPTSSTRGPGSTGTHGSGGPPLALWAAIVAVLAAVGSALALPQLPLRARVLALLSHRA